MRRVTEQRTLPALGSGGITGLNVGRRSLCPACSHEPPFLLFHFRLNGYMVRVVIKNGTKMMHLTKRVD